MKNRIALMLMLAVGFAFSCKKNDDPKPSTPSTNTITINSPVQFVGKVNGSSVSYSGNESSGSNTPFDGTTGETHASYSASVLNSSFVDKFYVEKGTITYTNSLPTNSQFKTFFTPGNVPFSVDAENGIEVVWFDDNGDAWSSSDGDQAGSTFKIEEIKEESTIVGYYIKVKATINCKVYKGTESKTITDGTFIGNFGNF